MPQGPDVSCLEPVRGLGAEEEERGPWGAEEGSEHSPGYGWGVHGNGAGSGDADYCSGSVYLLDALLHNSEVVDVSVFLSALQRESVWCGGGGRGLGDDRPGLGRPPGSSTQTLKIRGFHDCVDLKKQTKKSIT